MQTLPQTGLQIWNSDSDLYNDQQLADNFSKLNYGDHTPGKGVPIPKGGLVPQSVGLREIGTDVPLYFTSVTARSANYVAIPRQFVIMTGAHTVTLPPSAAGIMVGVQSTNGTGAAPCTISSSANIIGSGVPASTTSILLGSPGATVTLFNDGTNWHIISGAQDSGWIIPSISGISGLTSVTFNYRLRGDIVTIETQIAASASSGTASLITLGTAYRPTIGPFVGAGVVVTAFPTISTAWIGVSTSGVVSFAWTATGTSTTNLSYPIS